MSNKNKGLYGKYYVYKIVNADADDYGVIPEVVPVNDWVFVLNPRTDPGAVAALTAYIDWARGNGYDALATDLEEKLAGLRHQNED